MGSIPNVTQRGYTSGALLPGYVCPNDKHRCSVGRAHDSYYAFIFFFFCLPFVYPHILHAAKFWTSLGELGPRYVPERGCLATRSFFFWSAWKTRVQPRRLYEYYLGPPKRRIPKNVNKPRKQCRNRPGSGARNGFSYRKELCYETAVRASPTVYCGH